ncbi:MAG: transglutaminase domain-containing protein [Deltaproteobacteria bacterium]|nr:transglutaminase domain-containing protein [Deltaproteobacteria bacterium]
MRKIGILVGLSLILVAGLATAGYAWASPSENLNEIDGDVFDDWEICRTRAFGVDGFYQVSEATFRPVIAFESLGQNAATAYRLGEQFAGEYPDSNKRAEAIFGFVRDRVRYTTDIDQFEYEEFAQNADEMAAILEGGGAGYGDCEDSAVLLAVMYKGAGYRSAIVIGEGHTAAMVYLPDYAKTPVLFEVDGEPGWVWAEATGRQNPLGWTAKEFIGVTLAAYEITEDEIVTAEPTAPPLIAVSQGGGGGGGGAFPTRYSFFGIIFLLWIIPSLFRKKRRRTR